MFELMSIDPNDLLGKLLIYVCFSFSIEYLVHSIDSTIYIHPE